MAGQLGRGTPLTGASSWVSERLLSTPGLSAIVDDSLPQLMKVLVKEMISKQNRTENIYQLGSLSERDSVLY